MHRAVARAGGDLIFSAAKKRLWLAALLLVPLMPGLVQAQVRLRRSVSPAVAQIVNGRTAASAMPMEIAVRLNLRNAAELEQLKRDQQDPSSPSYHKWLSAAQFNARFGPTPAAADAVAQWLAGAGFVVTGIDLDRHLITAKANAAVVTQSLDVAIETNGPLFANTTEPALPAALAPLIANIEGLHNTFAVKPALAGPMAFEGSIAADGVVSPDFNGSQGLGYSPADFRTYYNETPLIAGGNSGTRTPDCIALAGISNLHQSSVTSFDTTFHLPPASLKQVSANGTKAGYNSAEIEAALDVEYAHAIAPATPLRLYVGAGSDLLDAIDRAVNDNACGVISISFGYCGEPSSFFTGTLEPIFARAAVQGQTVFVSSGDQGAAGLVFDGLECVVGHTPNVNEMSADPDVTSVGGTQFSPQYNAANQDLSTVHDGLDSAWNENDEFQGATGGGNSAIFPRPPWQTGSGLPAGNMRMVPDVSFGASGSRPGFYIVAFDNGKNRVGLVAGTSISSPVWAGYSRLIGKVSGNRGRLGSINPRLYQIGQMGDESGLIDVIGGNNTFNLVTGFTAGTGYDQATGWGSPDMTELLNAYLTGGSAAATPVNLSHPPATVIAAAGEVTLTNVSSATLSVSGIQLKMTHPGIFRTVGMKCGGRAASTVRGVTTAFNFRPPIALPVDGTAACTLSATLGSLAKTYTSVQTITGASATVAGDGVTFSGLPVELGSITLAPLPH